jgi:peroxiredoxin Q/BCP
MLILGVSFDGVEKNAKFAAKQEFPYQLLCDTDKQLSRAYGAAKGKASLFPDRITYVIDADGTIEWAEKVGDIDAHVHAALARLTQA